MSRAIVLLSVLGLGMAAPFLQDTPEVAAERARFTALYEQQAAAAAAAPDPLPVWRGAPAAFVPAGLPGAGNVRDTPEVAAATAAFRAAFNAQLAATGGQAAPAPFLAAPAPAPAPVAVWRGAPAATIPAGLPGAGSNVAETPEVAAANQAFAQAYSAALQATAAGV